MEYKGYVARIEFDEDAKLFHGEVVNTRDVITFQGISVDELEKALKDSVDDYLEFCKQRDEEPERPYSGNFRLRVTPALHRALAMRAKSAGQSLNSCIVNLLKELVS